MLNFETRVAVESDAQAISTLIIAGSSDGTGVEGSQDELDEWRLTNAAIPLILRRIAEDTAVLLVAQLAPIDGQVGLFGTGYVSFGPDRDAYIGGVYCSVRGQGVGRRITEQLIEIARERGVNSVEMTIARRNEAMRGLALRLHFVQEDEFTEDRFYRTGFFGRWFLRT